jgi:hypothetical protein
MTLNISLARAKVQFDAKLSLPLNDHVDEAANVATPNRTLQAVTRAGARSKLTDLLTMPVVVGLPCRSEYRCPTKPVRMGMAATNNPGAARRDGA